MMENQISKIVLDAAFKVHTKPGPGLLESAYRECLFHELKKLGMNVKKEVSLVYEEVRLDVGCRVDLLINNKFIVEIKSVDKLNDVFLAQRLTYLKLSKIKLGLLINFNVSRLKHAIKRVINGKL